MAQTSKKHGLMTTFIGGIMSMILVACGNGDTADPIENSTTEPTAANPSIAGSADAGVDTTASGEPMASDRDPCTILTIDEINEVFPGNDEPVAAEGTGCLFEGMRIDLMPLSLETIQAEEDPTGWDITPIEIEGADWAVVRIDTNVTEYEKVLDVIASGPNGTVHLIADYLVDVEMDSPTYEGMVDLLQTAMDRI